jgi:hypothetical protein
MTSRTYLTEHPRTGALPFDPEDFGFIDQSWHNDVCASFWNEEKRLKLWIDYELADDREFPEEERFALYRTDAEGEMFDGRIFATEHDVDKLLLFITSQPVCTPYVRDDANPNVYDLLVDTFGVDKVIDSFSPSHIDDLRKDFPLSSHCGEECSKVIDAWQNARDSFADYKRQFADIAIRQCGVICFG